MRLPRSSIDSWRVDARRRQPQPSQLLKLKPAACMPERSTSRKICRPPRIQPALRLEQAMAVLQVKVQRPLPRALLNRPRMAARQSTLSVKTTYAAPFRRAKRFTSMLELLLLPLPVTWASRLRCSRKLDRRCRVPGVGCHENAETDTRYPIPDT